MCILPKLSDESPQWSSPMATPLRKVLNRISGLAIRCTKNNSPCGCRDDDVEQHARFHYATTRCLSSHYSVFVARLAIMVMLAILIGLLTVLTWHFTTVYTEKSLHLLAYGLRYEILQRPILRMWSILNSTAEVTTAQVKLSEYIISKYSKPANQAQQVEVHFSTVVFLKAIVRFGHQTTGFLFSHKSSFRGLVPKANSASWYGSWNYARTISDFIVTCYQLYDMMRAATWALFVSRKALNSITVNYKNGFVQGFHRDHRSNNTFYIYSDLVNYSISAAGSEDSNLRSSHQGWNNQSIKGNLSAIWYREPLDPITGQRIGKPMPVTPEDLINIAGLSQVPDGVASWHVAVSKFTDSPLLSAALPVWDANNENIVAVVGVTTALYSVGQLMKELVEVHSGHIYLTSQEGYLLATSTNVPLLRNSTTGPKLMMAVNSSDSIIRAGAQWLQKLYGDKLPPGHAVHVEDAKLDHHRYYMDSFFLNLKRLPMVGVIMIPRKYIMGKVEERAYKTLIILVSASVGILIIGCVCILILTNGVSKEMKLRAELISHLDARRRAEASSNYKSQFLANMSHELRTPMAAVIGLLDILISDDCLTNEQCATVTQIRKCSTALLRLLNNILDLSKVESGKLVLEETEFDLGRELEGLFDMFSVQCINHNVETVLDLCDDVPKLVRGDSARVVQIFVNLISNSIKFTTSGHIILRGWCENLGDNGKFLVHQRKPRSALNTILKHHGNHMKKTCKKENKVMLCFEIDDTGCGIDTSKWESVFESFEQADPSTTRTHGGTGLGLCIVRTLVNKMGGEIKVVKKNGRGTLMRLYLLLNAPVVDGGEPHCEVNYTTHNIAVLVALYGTMGREVISKWLCKNGVSTLQSSDWNELTQVLRQLFHCRRLRDIDYFNNHSSLSETLRAQVSKIRQMRNLVMIIVVDISLLDLSTDIWKEQINYLDKFSGKAKFAWMLKHDTSNAVKMALREKGHTLMVNKPLYKTKMIQILEAVMKDISLELNQSTEIRKEGNLHECLEIDSKQFDTASSDDSDIPDKASASGFLVNTNQGEGNSSVEMKVLSNTENGKRMLTCTRQASLFIEPQFEKNLQSSCSKQQETSNSNKAVKEEKALQGLRIMIAEDTPVLQRVATIMLEKLGAIVVVVGDGMQAVNALTSDSISSFPPIDLILMDCQMPKMDGYEATKAIRKSEKGSNMHIPIVALTAHAMSSDEAKCLEVGMDAYLTKPIDYEFMVSTIVSLTKRA